MVAAAVGAAASVAGAAMQSSASEDAAQMQADAANNAAQMQWTQWKQTQENLKPYLDLGNSYINPLKEALSNPIFSQKFNSPSEVEAQSTPGYQFTLNQGLKSTQNSAAARGLGSSGAALKGAASYATGLADSTYNDVFNRALQTFSTNYSAASNNANRLQSIVGAGQNAAASQGVLGSLATNNIGNTLMGGANASAAGIIGSANAWGRGLNGLSNAAAYGSSQNNSGGSWAPSGGQMTPGSNGYGFYVP